MKDMIITCELEGIQRETPRCLPKNIEHELRENFRYLDVNSTGQVSFQSLIDAGLIDPINLDEMKQRFHADTNGSCDWHLFLEMLCPYGLLPHKHCKRIWNEHGEAMSLITLELSYGSWSHWIRHDDLHHMPKWVLQNLRKCADAS